MSPSLDLAAVEQWFYLLHGDCPGLSVVSSPLSWSGKASRIAGDVWPGSLVDYVNDLDAAGAHSIYLRTTTVASPPEQHKRGSADESVALPALWMDIDIAGPGHKPIMPSAFNPNPLPLPPDEEACLKIIEHAADFGLPQPTLWVHSGGGMYPWWFFKQPIILGGGDGDVWSKANAKLHDIVQFAANDLGWHYGTGTHDLARVMRIPGTVNRKVTGAPTQARIFADFATLGTSYTAGELLDVATTTSLPTPVAAKTNTTISMNTQAPRLPGQGKRPGDDYNERGDLLHEVLIPAGWQTHSMNRGTIMLTRPGKDRRDGFSASLGHEGSNNLYVFSTDAGLPVQEPLSPFYLFTHYNCGGDFAEAGRQLRALGYGAPFPTTPSGEQQATKDMSAIMGPTPVDIPDGGEGEGEATVEVASVVTTRKGGTIVSVDLTDPAASDAFLIADVGREGGVTQDIFRYNGTLVRIPACELGGRRNKNSMEDQMITLTPSSFGTLLGQRYRFIKKDNRKAESAPPSVARPTVAQTNGIFAMVSSGDGDNIRTLKGVTATPILRSDGSLWDTAGFDPLTGYVYIPDPTLALPPIPVEPTSVQIASARREIDLLLTDFPFLDNNHRNNYIGFMISPLLTTMISQPMKLGVIGAHQAGSGKSLLATMVQLVHGGSMMPALHNNDEELRKQITSNLYNANTSVCVWDNASGHFSSPCLDALLTSRTWSDRMLGHTQQISLVNDRLWLMTGNNLSLGSDLSRRTTWCTINPNVPHPEKRTGFLIEDMKGYVVANRGKILWALYTLIAAWRAKGMPTWCENSDSFCEWVGAVNGILRCGGWEGQFDTDESKSQEDGYEACEWGDFFEAIYEVKGENTWTCAEVISLVKANALSPISGISGDILPNELATEFFKGATQMASKVMGRRMGEMKNSFRGGYQLVRSPNKAKGVYRWHLKKSDKVKVKSTVSAKAPEDLADWSYARTNNRTAYNRAREAFGLPAVEQESPVPTIAVAAVVDDGALVVPQSVVVPHAALPETEPEQPPTLLPSESASDVGEGVLLADEVVPVLPEASSSSPPATVETATPSSVEESWQSHPPRQAQVQVDSGQPGHIWEVLPQPPAIE